MGPGNRADAALRGLFSCEARERKAARLPAFWIPHHHDICRQALLAPSGTCNMARLVSSGVAADLCKKQAQSLPSRAPNWSSTTPLRSLSVIDIVPPRNTSSRRFFPAGPAPSGTAVACCFGFAAGATCCCPVGIGEAALFGADFEGAGLGWACVAADSVLGKHTGRTATTRARTVGSPSRMRRAPLIRDISHIHAFLQPGCSRPREAQRRPPPHATTHFDPRTTS